MNIKTIFCAKKQQWFRRLRACSMGGDSYYTVFRWPLVDHRHCGLPGRFLAEVVQGQIVVVLGGLIGIG
jgi:hypothetical protein